MKMSKKNNWASIDLEGKLALLSMVRGGVSVSAIRFNTEERCAMRKMGYVELCLFVMEWVNADKKREECVWFSLGLAEKFRRAVEKKLLYGSSREFMECISSALLVRMDCMNEYDFMTTCMMIKRECEDYGRLLCN